VNTTIHRQAYMLFGSLCTIVTNFQDSTDAIHATADHDRELNSSL